MESDGSAHDMASAGAGDTDFAGRADGALPAASTGGGAAQDGGTGGDGGGDADGGVDVTGNDEWQDYSNASPWEEFVCALESALRSWGLGSQGAAPQPRVSAEDALRSLTGDTAAPHGPGSGSVGTGAGAGAGAGADGAGTAPAPSGGDGAARHSWRVITYAGRQYKLSYYTCPPPQPSAWRQMRGEHLPRALVEALHDPGADFPQRAHKLQRWFGVKEFVVLAGVARDEPGFYFRCVGQARGRVVTRRGLHMQ